MEADREADRGEVDPNFDRQGQGTSCIRSTDRESSAKKTIALNTTDEEKYLETIYQSLLTRRGASNMQGFWFTYPIDTLRRFVADVVSSSHQLLLSLQSSMVDRLRSQAPIIYLDEGKEILRSILNVGSGTPSNHHVGIRFLAA